MMTLERAILEYFRLSRPEFSANNSDTLPIFAASAVALATRMWIKRHVPIPGTFYIALVGEPRTGKTAFYHAYLRLLSGTGVGQIPVGSPPSMVKSLDAIRHGYVYYDEVSHLAKLINSYMGDLLPILNRMYYLDAIEQTRTDSKRSVAIPSEEYFVHVYFAGTSKDWKAIEDQAMGGFVRRTLVVYVKGQIPFFVESSLSIEEEKLRAKLSNVINTTLRALTNIQVFVEVKGLYHLANRLEKEFLNNEKKSMVEEYMYKILAGRLLANLITIDPDEDPKNITTELVKERIKNNAMRQGVSYDEYVMDKGVYEVHLSYEIDAADDSSDAAKITDYLPPNFARMTYEQLVRSVRPLVGAPDEVTLQNVERIKQWLEAGGPVVISKRKFAQQILHTTNPQFYKPVLEILQDAGYIRVVDHFYKNRSVQYVILDPQARICGNCEFYHSMEECPKLRGMYDLKAAIKKVPPWAEVCEKFELAGEDDGGDR